VLFVLAIGGLAGVSCRNPGMVEETNQEEKEGDLEKADWVWNDRVKRCEHHKKVKTSSTP